MAVTPDICLKPQQVNCATLHWTASTLPTLHLTGLSNTDEAYSSCGLTKFLKHCSRIVVGQQEKFLCKLSDRVAFLAVVSIWVFQESLLLINRLN